MQARAPPARGVDHPGHQRGAIRAEDRLRRLDLQLEAQRSGARLEPLGGEHHRLDLVDRGDLGQRDHEARRHLAETLEEQRERAHPAAPGVGVEALEADAVEGARRAVVDCLPQRGGRLPDRLVLLLVGSVAVAVLEVDPQVLDRLVRQLAQHPVEDVVVTTEHVEQQRAVHQHRLLRRPAEVAERLGREAVGGQVERVHRLSAGPLAGELLAQRGVRTHQVLVQLGDKTRNVHTGTLVARTTPVPRPAGRAGPAASDSDSHRGEVVSWLLAALLAPQPPHANPPLRSSHLNHRRQLAAALLAPQPPRTPPAPVVEVPGPPGPSHETTTVPAPGARPAPRGRRGRVPSGA